MRHATAARPCPPRPRHAGVGAQRGPGAARVLPGRPGARHHRTLPPARPGQSTVHRLVTTLAAERLLERGSTPGRYRLGLVLYELGSRVTEHVDLHQAALPVITTLRHETGEMVHVAVLDGLEVVYVERLESHNMLPIFRQVGHRLPAHWTSSGKILLGALPPDELTRRLALAAGGPDPVDHHRQEPAAGRAGGGGPARLGAEQRGGAPRHRLGGRADPRPGRQRHGGGLRRRRQRPDAHDDAPGHRAGGRVGPGHLPPAGLQLSAGLPSNWT